jgi:hypothetical protein
MYKTIQLTDQELELLHKVLGWYLTEKRLKNDPKYNSGSLIITQTNGSLTHNDTNQIIFCGK